MVQERCEISYAAWQLDHVRSLMGKGAWAKQLFYGITAATTEPQPYLERLHRRCLPIAALSRLSVWKGFTAARSAVQKPQPDWPGGLPEHSPGLWTRRGWATARDGPPLLVQLWNEPNSTSMGRRGPAGRVRQFLEQTAGGIRLCNRRGPTPGRFQRAPGARRGHRARNLHAADLRRIPTADWAFDVWAAHSYPGNYPPS